jgi:hypothetical protein
MTEQYIRAICTTPTGYEKHVMTLKDGHGSCDWVEIDIHEYNRIRLSLARFRITVDRDYYVFDIDLQRQESQAAADHAAWCAEMDENASRGQGWL